MKKYIEPLIHILIWGVGCFLILNYSTRIGSFKKDDGPFLIVAAFGVLMNLIIFYATAFFLVPKLLGLKKTNTLVISLLVGFIGITLLESFIDYQYLANLFSSKRESFIVHFFQNALVGFFILLVALSYALLKYWVYNEKLKRVLLEEKLSTEMAFLKSKINPHFLFNVLNSFYAKSLKHNVPELADGIVKLAELMRYMVYETNEDKVLIEKEIHHLKNFIQVYQLRMSEDDEVHIDFETIGDTKAVKISPMLLIPFVENAIKHGVDSQKKSIINIFIEVKQHKLYFKVINTIHKTPSDIVDDSSGFGLDNLKKRLSVLYPNAHTIETKIEEGCFIALLSLELD